MAAARILEEAAARCQEAAAGPAAGRRPTRTCVVSDRGDGVEPSEDAASELRHLRVGVDHAVRRRVGVDHAVARHRRRPRRLGLELPRRLVDPSHGQFQFPTIFVALDEDVDLGADGRELRDVSGII